MEARASGKGPAKAAAAAPKKAAASAGPAKKPQSKAATADPFEQSWEDIVMP